MDEEYDIVPATKDDTERIAKFLRQTFCKYEPLNVAFQAPPDRPSEAIKSLRFLKEGTSLIAITKSGLIIGVAINGSHRKDELPDPRSTGLESFHESYTRITNFVNKTKKNMDLWKTTGADIGICLHILSVDPIVSGRGLGKKLAKLSIDMARSKGFPFIWLMCTSHYSAKICRSLGMENVYKVPYKDLKNEAGVPECLPPAPHTEINVYIQRFNENY